LLLKTFLPALSLLPSSPSTIRTISAENPPPFNVNNYLPYRWRLCENFPWKPETREGATFTVIKINNETRAYLFGGLSRDMHCSIVYLTLSPTKYTYSWKIESAGDETKKRYGHTAVAYEDQLVIMGGARMYSKEAKQRDCLCDVLMLNPVTHEWTEIVPEGLPCEPRRYHSACMIGSQLVIYGGINGRQQYLSDLIALNLGKSNKLNEFTKLCKWNTVYTKGHKPGNLANHSCRLVLHPERLRTPNSVNLHALPEIRTVGKNKIEYEGIYIFGGRDEKGPKNRLFILKIGQKPCEWIEPSVEGTAPMARYGHSMNYYPDKNILIMFGGRNDDNFERTGQNYFNDIWILTLDKLRWIQWEKEECGPIPAPRYSHTSVVLGSAVIIFGGLGEENYCKADIHSLEMEEIASLKILATKEKEKFKSPPASSITRFLPLSPTASLFDNFREKQEEAKRKMNLKLEFLTEGSKGTVKETHQNFVSDFKDNELGQ